MLERTRLMEQSCFPKLFQPVLSLFSTFPIISDRKYSFLRSSDSLTGNLPCNLF